MTPLRFVATLCPCTPHPLHVAPTSPPRPSCQHHPWERCMSVMCLPSVGHMSYHVMWTVMCSRQFVLDNLCHDVASNTCCPSVCQSVCVSLFVCLCLSVHLSVCLSVCLTVCLPVRLPVLFTLMANTEYSFGQITIGVCHLCVWKWKHCSKSFLCLTNNSVHGRITLGYCQLAVRGTSVDGDIVTHFRKSLVTSCYADR